MYINKIKVPQTTSTNALLADYEQESTDEVTVVTTDYQTAGRGQGGNSWESERGKNLLFSVLIHPTAVVPTRQFTISMAVATAIATVLRKYMPQQPVTVKWPNDIYVGDNKICGILIETTIKGGELKDCIIGVGLNVNQRQFLSDAPNPVSIAQLTGHDTNRDILLDELIATMITNINRLASRSGMAEVKAEYHELLYKKGVTAKYKDCDGIFEAQISHVEDTGMLIVTDNNGNNRSYAFKEIEFITDNRI